MMRRLVALTALSALTVLAGHATADPKADSKGTITAYEMDGKTVIKVVACETGKLGPEFPKCLADVKAKLKADNICKGVKKGDDAKFKYRMGDIATVLTDKIDCDGVADSKDKDDKGKGKDKDKDDKGKDKDDKAKSGDPKPESKGTITAYEMDGKTVLKVVACETGKLGPEFPKCLVAVKARLKADNICKGAKVDIKFKYRMGDIATVLTDKVDC